MMRRFELPDTSNESKSTERRYIVDRFGPAQVLQCYADGFESLTPQQRIFAYHLALALRAGRNIYIDQKSAHGMDVKRLLEAIYPFLPRVAEPVQSQIREYIKLFWINSGFYDHTSGRKFIPKCSFEEFRNIAHDAHANGVRFNLRSGEQLDDMLGRLQRAIFDAEFLPSCTNKSADVDILIHSHNNLYEDVSFEEVETWSKAGGEKYPLNSKVIKVDGEIHEIVYRAGDSTIEPGMYADELRDVISHLRNAIPHACSEYQQETIRKLIRFFETGEERDFDEYSIHWVHDRSLVDFILGFIEVYLDARGRKGAFEGTVFFIDPAKQERLDKLASLAEYFERKAPWKDEYKKDRTVLPSLQSVTVLYQVGDAGPITPIGINLPNAQWIREQHGSKSVSLANIMLAYDAAAGNALIGEFACDDAEIDLHKAFGSAATELHVALHEVIGHGSGKVAERLAGVDPQALLPGYYSTIEETRADLTALYHGFDSILVEQHIIDDLRVSEAEYRAFVRNALVQLRRVEPPHDRLEEDHMRNRQIIVHYLLERSSAIQRIERDGKLYLRVADIDAMRKSIGELLAEVMRIKAEGDFAAAAALVETYGTSINLEWRDQVRRRVEPLDLPLYNGFVYPRLVPAFDAMQNVIDVTLLYEYDFEKQMME